MADTMTLEELRARLHPTGDDGEWFDRDELALMVEGIDAAIKQREQDAKDAARYQWLRDMRNREAAADLVSFKMNLDTAIDAAMAKESGNG